VVLMNGRPLAIPRVADRSAAILETWYGGQEGGTAIGEVLFGAVNPGGKLTVSFPRETGQLPVYYNRRPTSYRPYLDVARDGLWTFGRGLSYTTFAVTAPVVSPATIGPGGRATVTVDITNTGTRAGDEVVQLYIRDVLASVARPVLSLQGFARVRLQPGEHRDLAFRLDQRHLGLINLQGQRVVEPGVFRVYVGASSQDIRLRGELVVR